MIFQENDPSSAEFKFTHFPLGDVLRCEHTRTLGLRGGVEPIANDYLAGIAKNRSSEDAVYVSPDLTVAIVADGVGGSKKTSGPWAEFLTDRIGTSLSNLSLLERRTDVATLKSTIKQSIEAARNTFDAEGTSRYTTLSVVVRFTDQNGDEKTLVARIGDSPIFAIDSKAEKRSLNRVVFDQNYLHHFFQGQEGKYSAEILSNLEEKLFEMIDNNTLELEFLYENHGKMKVPEIELSNTESEIDVNPKMLQVFHPKYCAVHPRFVRSDIEHLRQKHQSVQDEVALLDREASKKVLIDLMHYISGLAQTFLTLCRSAVEQKKDPVRALGANAQLFISAYYFWQQYLHMRTPGSSIGFPEILEEYDLEQLVVAAIVWQGMIDNYTLGYVSSNAPSNPEDSDEDEIEFVVLDDQPEIFMCSDGVSEALPKTEIERMLSDSSFSRAQTLAKIAQQAQNSPRKQDDISMAWLPNGDAL